MTEIIIGAIVLAGVVKLWRSPDVSGFWKLVVALLMVSALPLALLVAR